MTGASAWSIDDTALRAAYQAAAQRFEAELRRHAPYAWEQVGPWVYQGVYDGDLSGGWIRPRGFPLLVLPRWFLGSVGAPFDPEFVADLDFSTINGYYFVRLVDQIMDGELLFHPRIVVTTAFFHSRFQGTLVRYFGGGSEFWPTFQRVWDEYVEVTLRDAFLEQIDEAAFRSITGRKFTAAQIPLAAAAHRAGAVDRLEPWLVALEPLGRWQQMLNDLFDWFYDREHGTATWIRSEAERRVLPDESLDAWFAREGFQWGRHLVDRFHADAVRAVEPLGSAPFDDYLARRKAEVDADLDVAADGVKALAALVDALE